MKLHVFNPEHDIALASFRRNFTAPHAGRQLRGDLGFLPALWAEEGDVVWVDDVESANEHLRHIKIRPRHDIRFMTKELLRDIATTDLEISPWGWNPSLKYELMRAGIAEELLPTDQQLCDIRNLSSRAWACGHLQSGVRIVDNPGLLDQLVRDTKKCVLKSPWSSSGRGVRYVSADSWGDDTTRAWALKVIDMQGCIVMEPYYNKVRDFAMEFDVLADGKISYRGLSLFHTEKGAYTGSVIASETVKESLLAPFVSASQLRDLRQYVVDIMTRNDIYKVYTGPFGVDMMVYATDDGLKVNPCVELNLRRTMGHVALALSSQASGPLRLMGVHYDGSHYHLRVKESNQGAEELEDYIIT